MDKNRLLTLFVFLFLILSISSVLAQPPFQQSTILNNGIDIESPVIEILKQNEPFEFNIHAHNVSNGLVLTGNEANCTIHVYNMSDGEHIIRANMSFNFNNEFDFEYKVAGGNFSGLGQHAVLFYCEVEDEIGGFLEYPFIITKNGDYPTTAGSIFHIILTLGVFLLFLIALYFMIILPFRNNKNPKGDTIQIVKMKYIKVGLLLIVYPLFLWFLNLLNGIALNFVTYSLYSGYFGFIFSVLTSLSYPIFIIVGVWFFFQILKDIEISKEIKTLGSSLRGV